MFEGVLCRQGKKISLVCLQQSCKVSPFVCSESCDCFFSHPNCPLKNIHELDENIKKMLKFQFFIVFSPLLRGESIDVVGRFASQTQPPRQNNQIALTFDKIPFDGGESVAFRLAKIKGCVGVGVFMRQILEGNSFRYVPNNQFLNHGCFMMLSNEMLYSHSNKEENGKSVSKFHVNEGDVIKVQYKKGKVRFTSNFLTEEIHVQIDQKYSLHFGVYLYEVEDEVEILNNWLI